MTTTLNITLSFQRELKFEEMDEVRFEAQELL